jgi:dTMP kinase
MGVIRLVEKSFCISKDRGILIVFEGISGCGKSESVDRLLKSLRQDGLKTKVVEWNSNKVIRGIVKKLYSSKLLTSGMYSVLQWFSFIIDYLFKIIPYLRKDYILIADRYVYTGLTRDAANGAGIKAGKKLVSFVRKPDLILFYDIDLHICYERIQKRGKRLFRPGGINYSNEENLEYLIKLHNEYLKILNQPSFEEETNIVFITGSSEPEKLRVKRVIDKYISSKLKKVYFDEEELTCKPDQE